MLPILPPEGVYVAYRHGKGVVTPGRFVPFTPRPQTIRGVVRIA